MGSVERRNWLAYDRQRQPIGLQEERRAVDSGVGVVDAAVSATAALSNAPGTNRTATFRSGGASLARVRTARRHPAAGGGTRVGAETYFGSARLCRDRNAVCASAPECTLMRLTALG